MRKEDWNSYKKRLTEDQQEIAKLIEIKVKMDIKSGFRIDREYVEELIYNSPYPNELYMMVNYLVNEYGRK